MQTTTCWFEEILKGLSSEAGTLSNRNNSPFDVYGSPAISVPCGFTTGGLPIGLQIVGNHGSEATVLQLAYAYEQGTDWHKRRPPVRGATPFLGKA